MIDLTEIRLANATPAVLDFGGTLTPALGGPRQRINRLGTRWAFEMETPLLDAEPDLRIWASRLARAKLETGLVWIPEPDLVFGPEGAPRVAQAVAGGTSLPLSGLSARLAIPEGKWLSIIHDGRRCVYQVARDTAATAGGTATLPIFPMLRTMLVPGDVVELAVPKVQGEIEGDFSWDVPVGRFASLSFTIAEEE
ncbi:hypothetical protein [uncultured Sphingomonas sp.]|uniref:hypothetical protein n=1 Tax=uncultured Sphingomonas sp. TaxID=158754 RepID=UPI002626BB6E|nr:hypothetical protein [uncultured Sphingomonas sp.]